MVSYGIPGYMVIASVTVNGCAMSACRHLASVCSHFATLSPTPICSAEL